ncbi:MAG TPA: nitrous oxide reductase accessory protein NosL [Thermodesulfobacteriota bacterium]|nr:nitrous oxide reductase accessory protein NosL [Thermodesulfobacteriota bacterium]
MKRGLIFLSFLFLILSCQKDSEGMKPAEIFYGEDMCDRCSMIISEEEFSGQYLLPKGEVKKFDDIGCMVHYIAENETRKEKILAVFVRDYNSEEWISGEKSFYVAGKNIKTPMGYGLAALKERNSAENLAKAKGGEVFENLSEATNRVLSSETTTKGENIR